MDQPVNGKDGLIPDRCARCKKPHWDKPKTPNNEVGMRTRIKNLKRLYEVELNDYFTNITKDHKYRWPNGLIEEFLNREPRPDIAGLRRVLYPAGLIVGLNFQNKATCRGYYLCN
jgi:hypothetical protein